MFSLTALMKGKRMVLRSASMTLLKVVVLLVISSRGSIKNSSDKSYRLVSLNTFKLLVVEVEVTSLVDFIWDVAKVFMIVTPQAVFPVVQMV